MVREEWIDISRGVAILLVVLGHLPLDDTFHNIIYSFHMPLFFIISGFFISTTISLNKLMVSKSKRILLPYFIFGISLMLPFRIILNSLKTHTNFDVCTYGNGIIGHIIGLRSDWLFCGTYWFLPCLFTSLIIIFLISKYTPRYTLIFVILFSVLGFVYQIFIKRSLPMSLDLALIAVLFLYIGNIYYKASSKLNWRVSIMLGVFGLICALCNGKIEMYYGDFGNPILFILSGVGLSIFVLKLCKSIKGNKIMQWLGINSILIYMLHYVIRPAISYAIIRLPYQDYWLINAMYCIMGSVFICVFLYPVISIINKYLPFLIGKNCQ